jgi:hypothetical protein
MLRPVECPRQVVASPSFSAPHERGRPTVRGREAPNLAAWPGYSAIAQFPFCAADAAQTHP